MIQCCEKLINYFHTLNRGPVKRNEVERTIQRIAFSLVIAVLALYGIATSNVDGAVAFIPIIASLYIVASLVHWRLVVTEHPFSIPSQIVLMVLDIPLMVAAIAVDPENNAFLFPMVMALSVGVGFRYGTRLFWFSVVEATIAVALFFPKSPYWMENTHMFASVMVMMLLGMPFLHRVIRNLEKTNQDLANLALTDPLSGLHNRRSLNAAIVSAISRAKRSGRSVTFFIFDLDNFKRLNDSKGHNAGDIFIKRVAENLMRNHRSDDFVARTGGDEFVLIADTPTEADAEIIGDKISKSVYSANFHQDVTVTASIGAIVYKGQNASPDDILTQADKAMYASKKDGKNAMRIMQFK